MRPIFPEWEDYIITPAEDATDMDILKEDAEARLNYTFDLLEYVKYLEQTLEEYESKLYDV